MQAEERAAKVEMLVCDVDGVLTDGGLYYDDGGRVSKRFHVQDGFGIKMAQAAGLEVAIITGLESEAVRMRILELGISEYHAGRKDKLELLQDICGRQGLQADQLAFLGDDWVDAKVMQAVGLPMAVANAQPEVKQIAALVTGAAGGNGAVREAVRFILKAQGKLDMLWRQWLE
jgi:3-deoxy-D-manno-octulosonate 8-phosphate phosphatase (KDO 8-P phosphatase)